MMPRWPPQDQEVQEVDEDFVVDEEVDALHDAQTDPSAPMVPLAPGDEPDAPGYGEVFGGGAEGMAPESERAPADDDLELPMIAAPLPEMAAEMWQAGIQAVVTVPDQVPAPPWPSAEAWADEARLFQREADLAESVDEAAALKLAAARVAELAAQPDAAVAFADEALGLMPAGPDALRARARLAEGRGELDEALACWARLAHAAETAEEQAFYAALAAEWTLARDGQLPAAGREALAPGAARALAAAEEALLGGGTGAVAAALSEAGRAVGGPFGAALVGEAARFSELEGDLRGAEAQRVMASEIDAQAESHHGIFGTLRDAARMNDRDAAHALAELASRLASSSPLAPGIARWGARAARRRGDGKLAATLLDGLQPVTVAAARDRLDLELATDAPLDRATLDRLRADGGGPAGAATLSWIEAGSLLAHGDLAAAGAVLAAGLAQSPDAGPLGLLAEDLAGASHDPAARAAALELLLHADPARRAEAGLTRATLAGATPNGEAAARAALQVAVEAAPGSAAFWTAAQVDARAGRHADAAAALAYGAEAWAASALGPALRAAAAAHLALVEPARAAELLQSAPAARAFGEDAAARLAERTGNHELHANALADAASSTRDPSRRADLLARRALLLEDGGARVRALTAALEAQPDHPIALALALLAGAGTATGAGAEELWRAGEGAIGSARAPASATAGAAPEGAPRATAAPVSLGRLFRLTAAVAVAQSGDAGVARTRARALVAADPDDRAARLALWRATRRELAPVLARELPPSRLAPASDPIELARAESLAAAGDEAGAAAVFRRLSEGRFAADARRALVALGAEGIEGTPPRLLHGMPDEEAGALRTDLAALVEAARAGRWADVAVALETQPPHELTATAATLHAAALLIEGRCAPTGEMERVEGAALEAAGDDPEAMPLFGLARVAEGDHPSVARLRALELASRQLSTIGRPASVATIEAGIARLREAVGDGDGAAESWQAALAADPTYLPAALALRRGAARRGDIQVAVAAAETEAACLVLPAHRVRVLLLAASIAGDEGGDRPKALALLRSALEIQPSHDAAFEQLRALLGEAHDFPGLAEALGRRILVAANPFEVTSLRLARAEVLSTKLGDRAGAREELEAILQRQPEHARALARLSDLLWEDEVWEHAGEIYLRRTVVEREPRTLRDVFLRLGHIYGHRVPDPKRALAAFEQVRAVDPDNREALAALSEIYVAESDLKQALPVTERLVALESEPRRRTAYRVRFGDILMRSGDLRRAAIELRRAVDSAPRDVAAVTVLAQLLERARDHAGRRALLDHSVGLLRHDVDRGELDVDTLRALSALLALRERPRAAAAAEQLVVALGAGRADPRAAVPPPRHIEALRRPEVDERVFPPELPPGIRQIMRLCAPFLRPTGPELAHQLSRHGVTRADRVGRTEPPRPLFESIGALIGAGEFDLYIKATPPMGGPVPVRVEPGSPHAIVIGAPIVDFGPSALRFAAARTLRLAATGLDELAALTAEEAAALVVGIIRQFVPDYRHPDVREALVEPLATRAARLIPRKVRPQVMGFAVESAGAFDVGALHAAVRDGANAAGLLAAGDLPAALSVVLATSGLPSRGPTSETPLALSPIVAHPEGLALLRFAVSDAYDDLALAMESA